MRETSCHTERQVFKIEMSRFFAIGWPGIITSLLIHIEYSYLSRIKIVIVISVFYAQSLTYYSVRNTQF